MSPYTWGKYGYVAGKPRRYVHGHHARKFEPEYIKRDCNFETPCWIWQRFVSTETGYGRKTYKGKNWLAHRAYYEIYKGQIPAGLHIDHLCRVRCCVNPDHLEAVLPATNIQRSYDSKLTPEKAATLRLLYKSGQKTSDELAAIYGVHRAHVCRIARGDSWANV